MSKSDVGNGMGFQLSTSLEFGISPYSLLEAAWCLPAILYGIRNKIWTEPSDTAVMPHPVLVAWVEMGLITASPRKGSDIVDLLLTPGGINIVRMGELFEYEFHMMTQQLDGDFQTDPEQYVKLRKALAYYADTYLKPLTDWMVELTKPGARVLDFGGGDGYFLCQILDRVESTSGILYDKAPSLDFESWDNLNIEVFEEDFLKKGKFIPAHPHEFDTIIFSEVLHCLGPHQFDIVLPKLVRLLAPDGKLFILEQNTSTRMNWRLHDMTSGGFSMEPEQVFDIIQSRPHLGLEAVLQMRTSTHFAVCIQHVEVKNATTH